MNRSITLSATSFFSTHSFRLLSLIVGLIVGLITTATGSAQVTVGGGVANQGTAEDGDSGKIYIYAEGFGAGAVGHTLDTWSFYSANFAGSREVTPLLLEFSSGNDYTIRAIGTTIVAAGSTIYTQDFNDVFGSIDIDGSNFYFGWKDGGLENSNQGVISAFGFHSAVAASFSGSSALSLTSAIIDTDVNLPTALGVRGYRFTATTAISAVPEPSAIALIMGCGILVLTAYRRRR